MPVEHPYGLRDIFEDRHPTVGKYDIKAALDLGSDLVRNANAADFRNPFQAGCDVDAVAEDVVAFQYRRPRR